MLKYISSVVIFCLAIYVALSFLPGDQNPVDERITFVGSLFTGAEQYELFNRLKTVFPTRTIKAGPNSDQFPVGKTMTLPEFYAFDGENYEVTQFLDDTRTVALLVIQDGEIRYEDYWLTGGVDVNWMSMSVAKSFVSALIGIAIDEQLISGVEAPITTYVPELLAPLTTECVSRMCCRCHPGRAGTRITVIRTRTSCAMVQ